jgi:hypothetical protein
MDQFLADCVAEDFASEVLACTLKDELACTLAEEDACPLVLEESVELLFLMATGKA